jgi:predicted dehydrogenase
MSNPHSSGAGQSRRKFLRGVTAGTLGAGLSLVDATAGIASAVAPYVGRSRGGVSASDTVVVGIVGTGGRGERLAEYFARHPGARVAYVSDVDRRRLAQAQKTVGEHQDDAARAEIDFRRLLDDPSVDAVVLATPDHWHAPGAILAAAAGKHVYVEKPCSHNPREGELLVEAARRYDRVVQMGNQRRSWPGEQEAIAHVHGGTIGPVHYARTWYTNGRPSIGVGRAVPAPDWLDYELWQGPAPRTRYRDNILHYNWHWFWNWGTGESGNNGVHFLDLARWGLKVDYPTVVASTGGRYYDQDDQETPDTQIISLDFPGNRTVLWEGLSSQRYGPGGTSHGVSFHGEQGTILITGDGYAILDPRGQVVTPTRAPAAQEVDLTGGGYARDARHIGNFLDAIRGGEPLNSPIDEGHKSTLLGHLGNIALRTGRTLHCDPANGRPREEEGMALWSREYAPGWQPRV